MTVLGNAHAARTVFCLPLPCSNGSMSCMHMRARYSSQYTSCEAAAAAVCVFRNHFPTSRPVPTVFVQGSCLKPFAVCCNKTEYTVLWL